MKRTWLVALGMIVAAEVSLRAEVLGRAAVAMQTLSPAASAETQGGVYLGRLSGLSAYYLDRILIYSPFDGQLTQKEHRLETLRSIHAAVHKPRTFLAPAMEVGQEFDLWGYHQWQGYIETQIASGVSEVVLPVDHKHDWFTDDDLALPCFAMDYHRVVRDIGHAYDCWRGFCDLNILKTLRDADDEGFNQIIEWLNSRPERVESPGMRE